MAAATDANAPESFHRRRFRWRGTLGGLLLVPASMIALFSAPIVSEDSLGHVALQTLAWLSFAAGAGVRFWATLYVGGRKERELITDGPYSLCRHPLYLGSLLLGVSAGLFLESPVFLAALATVSVVYLRATIPVEEAVLRVRHGTRFDDYRRQVPTLWPRLRRVESPSSISVDVWCLWLECSRASRWLLLPVAGAAFSYLRTLAWWPRLFRML